MFHDEAEISVRSGDGGQGCVSFRREKFVPEGGPDGGDGGKGGDVIVVANPHLASLSPFTRKRKWKAANGQPGGSRNKAGPAGADLILELPCGTIIRHAETGEVLADVCEPERPIVLCAGGKGGGGNVRYKSSTNRVPRRAGPGETGTRLPLTLELKLIADIGLLGLPNAGKSTLLSRLSSARPKIANYPFTTLQPQLGVIEEVDRQLVIADIPGLIEGAADGVGLGHQFLRHVERCRLLLHLVDGSQGEVDEITARIAMIQHELQRFSSRLAERPQLLVLNKADLRSDLPSLAQALAERHETTVLTLSAVSGQGLDALRQHLLHSLSDLDKDH